MIQVQLANSGMASPMAVGGTGGGAENQQSMFDVAWEWNPDTSQDFGGARAHADITKQFALSKQTNCDQNPNNDQDANNCQKLNAAAATVDLGMLKFKPGEFKYMSSRNMNFSNRAQKAKLTVLNTPSVTPKAPVAVTVSAGSSDSTSFTVTWSAPGAEAPSIGFDGKEYWGMEQTNTKVIKYSVQYSIDGGGNWVTAGDQCASSPCTIDGLPAGTTVVVKVAAWGEAGQGDDSDAAFAQTNGNARVGCTYPSAANYNPSALNDDGTCVAGDGRRLFSGASRPPPARVWAVFPPGLPWSSPQPSPLPLPPPLPPSPPPGVANVFATFLVGNGGTLNSGGAALDESTMRISIAQLASQAMANYLVVDMVVAGDVVDFDFAAQELLKQRMSQLLGVDNSRVAVTVKPASVQVTIVVEASTQAQNGVLTQQYGRTIGTEVSEVGARLGLAVTAEPTVHAGVVIHAADVQLTVSATDGGNTRVHAEIGIKSAVAGLWVGAALEAMDAGMVAATLGVQKVTVLITTIDGIIVAPPPLSPPPPAPPSLPPPPPPALPPPPVHPPPDTQSSTDSANVAIIVIGTLVGLGMVCILIISVVVIRARASKAAHAHKESVVHVTISDSTEGTSPQNLAALLAACGLEHHASAFEAEGYTLESLLAAMKLGEEEAKRDLRELKLNLGECRKLIHHLNKTSK